MSNRFNISPPTWPQHPMVPERTPKGHPGLATIALLIGQHTHLHLHALWLYDDGPALAAHPVRADLVLYARWLRGMSTGVSASQLPISHRGMLSSLVRQMEFSTEDFGVCEALRMMERVAAWPASRGASGGGSACPVAEAAVTTWVSSGPLSRILYTSVRARVREKDPGASTWNARMQLISKADVPYDMGLVQSSHAARQPVVYSYAAHLGPMIAVSPSILHSTPLLPRLSTVEVMLGSAPRAPTTRATARSSSLAGTEAAVISRYRHHMAHLCELIWPSLILCRVSPAAGREVVWAACDVRTLGKQLRADAQMHTKYCDVMSRFLDILADLGPLPSNPPPAELFCVEYIRLRALESCVLLGLPIQAAVEASFTTTPLRTELADVLLVILEHRDVLRDAGSSVSDDKAWPTPLFGGAVRMDHRDLVPANGAAAAIVHVDGTQRVSVHLCTHPYANCRTHLPCAHGQWVVHDGELIPPTHISV